MERYIPKNDPDDGEEVLVETYCHDCDEDKEKNLRYIRRTASGEHWECKTCGSEKVWDLIIKEDEEIEIEIFKPIQIGATIKQIRKNKGIKQNMLALNVGVSKSYISRIENEIQTPTIEVLQKIANKLEVNMATIFTLAENCTLIDIKEQLDKIRK